MKNIWLSEIPMWWESKEVVKADQGDSVTKQIVRHEQTMSFWSNEISSLTKRLYQETDAEGRVKNCCEYKIDLAPYRHQFHLSEESYNMIQIQLATADV